VAGCGGSNSLFDPQKGGLRVSATPSKGVKAMKRITREKGAPERPPPSADGAASPPANGRQSQPADKPATRTLRGCAREGCLDVAKIGSDRCPLHD
jgi:hypothetical protein